MSWTHRLNSRRARVARRGYQWRNRRALRTAAKIPPRHAPAAPKGNDGGSRLTTTISAKPRKS